MSPDAAPTLSGTNAQDRRFVERMLALHEAARHRGGDHSGEEFRELRRLADRLGVAMPAPVDPPPPDIDTHDRHAVTLALRELAEGGDRRVRALARRVVAARRVAG